MGGNVTENGVTGNDVTGNDVAGSAFFWKMFLLLWFFIDFQFNNIVEAASFGSRYLATACKGDDVHREESCTWVLDSPAFPYHLLYLPFTSYLHCVLSLCLYLFTSAYRAMMGLGLQTFLPSHILPYFPILNCPLYIPSFLLTSSVFLSLSILFETFLFLSITFLENSPSPSSLHRQERNLVYIFIIYLNLIYFTYSLLLSLSLPIYYYPKSRVTDYLHLPPFFLSPTLLSSKFLSSSYPFCLPNSSLFSFYLDPRSIFFP